MQSKGRVERAFGTLQDRIVKELRLAGISTVRRGECLAAWLHHRTTMHVLGGKPP